MLTEVAYHHTAKNRHIYSTYKCGCGKIVVASHNNVNSGSVRSCGCSRFKAQSHGQAGRSINPNQTATYRTWKAMKTRCTNPKYTWYEYHGGRGISVCPEWLYSFENFYRAVGDRPKGMSLDRINNNGNYELSNCRWATSKQQAANRRHK